MKRPIVIVDIDGTVCSLKDKSPIMPVVNAVRTLSGVYDIVFCTVRFESFEAKTAAWIDGAFGYGFGYLGIMMRPNNAEGSNVDIKRGFVEKLGRGNIALVLEDNDSMIKMYNSLGITCLKVKEG